MGGGKSQMIKILLALFVMVSCTGLRMTFQKNVTSHDDPGSEVASEVTKILRDVTSLQGPLRNYGVTLMVEGELEEIISVNNLLKVIQLPKFFWQVSEATPSNRASWDNVNKNSMTRNSVLICIVKSHSWWPLWTREEWSPTAILLLVLSPYSHASNFLETPLLERTTFVAVLCPVIRQKPWKSIRFEVSTWKPYASGNQLVRLGTWNMTSFATWNRLFVDRFQDFSRKRFAVSCSWTDEPVLFKNDDGTVEGTTYRILLALSQWLKFEFDLNPHENNSWVGMRDDVRNGISDVMINYVTLTLERTHQFDVSIPYFNEGFGMVMKVPPPLPLWRNIYYPYTWRVWIAVGVALVIVSLTYHVLNYRHERSFILNVITVVQCLISQSSFKIPRMWRERWFISLWALLAWLLNLSYTCNLIAVLTIPVYPVKIQTARELADSSTRVCMLDYGEFVPEALRISTEQTLSALGRKLDMAPMRPDLVHWGQEGCIERVLANTHSHLETNYFVQILYHDLGHSSEVYMLKEQLYVGNLAFLFKKNTPWKGKFNMGMRRLIEAGIVAKFYSDILSKYTRKNSAEGLSTLKLLTMAHLQGAFMMLLIGLGMAAVLFALEVLFHSSRKTGYFENE